ncbi:MAG: 3-oxoacyl-ACP synthase [Flammeovirgaceae bacterium]|nr:3-oxoacyl-ACP synthase [Flammeovirgaceae bacterium]HCX24923.1 3-oxoacyl-ACP synthase [Cytophagales bacterium]
MNRDIKSLKQTLYLQCKGMVEEKIQSLQANLKGFQDAANEETKSSAGDKYETGRAMMHLEKEKVAHALNEVLKQKKVLDQLGDQPMEQGELGALIQTNKGYFYLSVSLGKMNCDGIDAFCLSPVSPLGQNLLGTKKGDQITFNKISYSIESIA